MPERDPPTRKQSGRHTETKNSVNRAQAPRKGISAERLRHWFTGRPRPMHLLLVVIFVVFGVALTTQVRSRVAEPLAELNEEELVALLADLQTREDDLRVLRSDLQVQLAELQDAATSQQAAIESAEKAAVQAQIVAGTVPVEGPGVVVQVDPSSQDLPPSTFVTTLAELRNAGAEAIALNGIRLTGRSWFGAHPGAVVVDGLEIEAPYVWSVIGDPQTLSNALGIRGGATAQLKAYGASVVITESQLILINEVAVVQPPQWSQPTNGE